MGEKYSKDVCIALLKAKALELCNAGEERYPSRSDFSPDEAAAIKAFLGPWPRALEAAGLKAPDAKREERKLEKRIEKKRRDTQRKILKP